MSFEFHASVSEDARSHIMTALSHIEQDNDVRILFAIESGSRAWGFPSPDSDYDVRFVYAHKRDWYLSLKPGRDVIELPIEDDWDINGWDIRKALNLLLKPNPVMLEWLSSPIKYLWDETTSKSLIKLSQDVAHEPACLNHYLNLGRRQWNVYVEGKDDINLKKYFYIVRPAMAIRWMRLKPHVLLPMNLQHLMAGVNLNHELLLDLEKLLIAKSQAKEIGSAKRIETIDQFIRDEFEWANKAVKDLRKTNDNLHLRANTLFREIINHEP